MKEKMLESLDQMLDVRKLMQSQVDLKLLKRRLMSPKQQFMFSY